VGLNHHSGDPIDPQMEGIFDNYSVKRQIINSGYVMQLPVCVSIVLVTVLSKTSLMCKANDDFFVGLCCRPIIASQLLLVDEVIRAGRNMRKPT
jgi:T-complex protein 1 subunit zeta